MNITIVTPVDKRSLSGNRMTAVRWSQILRDLGHKVKVAKIDEGVDADMMVAVHAWRSRKSIRAFSEAHPERPLIVLLAGTDIYRYQHSHSDETLESMERASRLVCLHDLVHQAIPKMFAPKLRVIHQSATPLSKPRVPSKRWFEVCVVGHVRQEKDPLRAPLAALRVPKESRLRVVHLGKAQSAQWEKDMQAEAAGNPRFHWRGEVPRWRIRQQFARSHAMIISSVMEGGANVVSEAIMYGLPIFASRIDGNVGLLGADYGGYFPVKDDAALAALLWRAETDPSFLEMLASQIGSRQPLFATAREAAAWRKLLQELTV